MVKADESSFQGGQSAPLHRSESNARFLANSEWHATSVLDISDLHSWVFARETWNATMHGDADTNAKCNKGTILARTRWVTDYKWWYTSYRKLPVARSRSDIRLRPSWRWAQGQQRVRVGQSRVGQRQGQSLGREQESARQQELWVQEHRRSAWLSSRRAWTSRP